MSTIFITGAASGLGKAFVQAFAAQSADNKIYALDRAFPEYSENFLDLPQGSEWIKKHIVPIVCDLTNPMAVSDHIGHLRLAIDLVVHSAGVRGLVPTISIAKYSDVAQADSLEAMDSTTLLRTFEINAIGTFLLIKALLPSLQLPAKPDGGNVRSGLPKVIVMGSRLGSIGHNTELGGAYAYRASKAALNAIVKSFSVDVPEAIWTIVHPGRVETGLVSIKEDDAMSVDDVVVNDLLPLITGLEKRDSGRFIDRFGVDIPW